MVKQVLKSVCLLFMLFMFSGVVKSYDIITNNDLGYETVSKRELRSIFSLGLTRFRDGTPITLVVYNEKTVDHNGFCKEVLEIFPHQLKSKWDFVKYSGTGVSPIIVSSEEEMVSKISTVAGAIGYIKDASKYTNIKVLKVK